MECAVYGPGSLRAIIETVTLKPGPTKWSEWKTRPDQ